MGFGRYEGVVDLVDLVSEGFSSSCFFRNASIHGVLTRMLVSSLYTPSVLRIDAVCNSRWAAGREG